MIPDPLPPFGVPLDVLNRYLHSLYTADWNDMNGPIRFSPDLKARDVTGVDMFHNTRILLSALLEEGGTPATATGNLTRDFVGRMLGRLRLAPHFTQLLRRVCKVINEQDVWPLHEVRLVAEYGKLVLRRNRRFVVTKLGRKLLADERAGELYRRLFLTYFRKLDLCYFVNVREQPEIQATLAITLWRLAEVAGNWRAANGIAARILPPRVLMDIVSQQRSDFDTPDFFVAAYVLRPLYDFGLVERKRESEWPIGEKDTIRVTPLFRKFIRFAEIPSVMNN